MIEFVSQVFTAGIFAGLIAVGVKRLFPKRGDWLPVLVSIFIPPLLLVAFSVYSALVAIGLAAERPGGAPVGPITVLTSAVGAYVFFALIWLFVAAPSAFLALHLTRKRK